jgi:hypothetical protein
MFTSTVIHSCNVSLSLQEESYEYFRVCLVGMEVHGGVQNLYWRCTKQTDRQTNRNTPLLCPLAKNFGRNKRCIWASFRYR